MSKNIIPYDNNNNNGPSVVIWTSDVSVRFYVYDTAGRFDRQNDRSFRPVSFVPFTSSARSPSSLTTGL